VLSSLFLVPVFFPGSSGYTSSHALLKFPTLEVVYSCSCGPGARRGGGDLASPVSNFCLVSTVWVCLLEVLMGFCHILKVLCSQYRNPSPDEIPLQYTLP